MPDHSYLGLASAMHRLTEPAIRAAISALPLASLNGQASRGLDAACGNGDHSLWLAQALLPEEQVMGLDICREGLLQARAAS
jgi:ubiquinone/menaquinone biosynthesis C-methylase UbiE